MKNRKMANRTQQQKLLQAPDLRHMAGFMECYDIQNLLLGYSKNKITKTHTQFEIMTKMIKKME